MAYIGRNIDNLSDRVKLDAITASATATYNLLLSSAAYTPSSAESLTVSLNGVIQAPQTSYSVSGSTIIFASALTSSDTIDFILAERAIQLTTVGSGTVGSSQITADVITGQTALGAAPADTDELLISDAGTLKRVDYSYIKSTNTPNFSAYMGSNQTVANATATKLLYNTEEFDSGSCYDASNSKFVVPSGEGGKYLFTAQFQIDTIDDGERVELKVYKNGSEDNRARMFTTSGHDSREQFIENTFILNLSASDYIEIYTQHNVGQDRTYYASHTRFSGFKLME